MSIKSIKQKAREFVQSKIGCVFDISELEAAAGTGSGSAGRRMRELREREGWKILSHFDKKGLVSGQYFVESAISIDSRRSISAKLRVAVLERDGSRCQLCGRTPEDDDPVIEDRKVRLHVDHIIPLSEGGTHDISNLRTTCSSCNQGRRENKKTNSGGLTC